MNITLVLPFLLFFLAVILNIIVINYKFNKYNQNTNTQKRILEKVRKAEQTLNENIVQTEEKISSQKIEVNNIGFQIDNKIQELNSHSQELAKLSNTLNEYRSMLAVLEVSTNKTHEWVITVRNDCKKLEELQKVIEEHQKSTLDIINSYGEAVEKQNIFYGEYETKLELIKNNYIDEVNNLINVATENLNSKIISMNQVSNQTLSDVENARSSFEELSNEHKVFASESKGILEQYKIERDSTLKNIKSELDNSVSSSIEFHEKSIGKANEQYLVRYSNEIDSLNSKKMEEADNALNNLIQSISYLKEATESDKPVENKPAPKVDKKRKEKNKVKSDTKNLTTKKTDQEKGEPISNQDNLQKEVDLKNGESSEKVFVAIGEEEEILID